jgi:hypothetical protein
MCWNSFFYFIYFIFDRRHLDISQYDESHGTYEHENKVLKQIVASLPNLVSLDISGTNLAGKGERKRVESTNVFSPFHRCMQLFIENNKLRYNANSVSERIV